MDESSNAKLIIEATYHRKQFDDWLAGGTVEYQGQIYYWQAEDSGYGYGWQIEPVPEEGWDSLSESETNTILPWIEECLCEHRDAHFRELHL